MKLLLNFAVFQLAWFSCVLGASWGLVWPGPLAVLAAALLHLNQAWNPSAELKLIGLAMMLGLVLDSMLLATGWLQYASGSWIPGLAPYWIVCMWALFATTLNVSMRWLRGRIWLAVLLGAFGGPMSYLAGEKLGAMTFLAPASALAALVVGWSVAMPFLMSLAVRFDGVSRQEMPSYIKRDWKVRGNA